MHKISKIICEKKVFDLVELSFFFGENILKLLKMWMISFRVVFHPEDT